MTSGIFQGPQGLDRLKAHMHLAFLRRPESPKRTQHYFRGWLHALASTSACHPDVLFDANNYVTDRGYEKAPTEAIELYQYPSDRYVRVEGKRTGELEQEILDGGPQGKSRVQKIYEVAEDLEHSLHFVAVHLMFLTRVNLAAIQDSKGRPKEQ